MISKPEASNIVPSETRIPPYWNSYNGAESNTGTLELGYLVLNDVLHLALMGGLILVLDVWVIAEGVRVLLAETRPQPIADSQQGA